MLAIESKTDKGEESTSGIEEIGQAMDVEICRAQTVEILHCCMKRGVHIRIHLNEALDLDSLVPTWVEKIYSVETSEGGFFRFNLCEIAAVSGISGAKAVTSMFAYFRKEEALRYLDRIFPRTREKYESSLASIV